MGGDTGAGQPSVKRPGLEIAEVTIQENDDPRGVLSFNVSKVGLQLFVLLFFLLLYFYTNFIDFLYNIYCIAIYYLFIIYLVFINNEEQRYFYNPLSFRMSLGQC